MYLRAIPLRTQRECFVPWRTSKSRHFFGLGKQAFDFFFQIMLYSII